MQKITILAVAAIVILALCILARQVELGQGYDMLKAALAICAMLALVWTSVYAEKPAKSNRTP